MIIRGRQKRHSRITKTMQGTAQKPRLVVFRSNKHMYAQLVNDAEQKVITGKSTLEEGFAAAAAEIKEQKAKHSNVAGAKAIGKMLAKKAMEMGIKEICFDRAGYKYHGRVKAVAEGAREAGLKF